jgi:hypothetical protein
MFRMGWLGHVACMMKKKSAYRILVGKPKERDCLKELGILGRIILKWISKYRVDWYRLALSASE